MDLIYIVRLTIYYYNCSILGVFMLNNHNQIILYKDIISQIQKIQNSLSKDNDSDLREKLQQAIKTADQEITQLKEMVH